MIYINFFKEIKPFFFSILFSVYIYMLHYTSCFFIPFLLLILLHKLLYYCSCCCYIYPLITMMSFCKKSVHSFLGLTIPMNNLIDCSNNDDNNIDSNDVDDDDQQKFSSSSSSKYLCLPVLTSTCSGLGLITSSDIDTYKTPPNVLESATFKSSSPLSSSPSSSLPSPSSPPLFKKDPGGIGFIDDVGGGVNGLMSCTESLGFESCDERRVDNEIDELCSRTSSSHSSSSSSSSTTKVNWRKVGERREVKKFPPPLSSLNYNGQPSFFLRPVRQNGRLALTEVRIDRPEILRAHREDGRLRLHLIRDDEDDEDADTNLEEYQEPQEYEPKEEQELEEDQEEEVQEKEEEEISGEWRFPVTGEGLRRCHELVTHHHQHNLHVLSQQCV